MNSFLVKRTMKRIAAFDIGGTKIAAGVVDEGGAILSRRECATEAKAGFAQAMERVKQMLRGMAAEGHGFDGIGIGCPGPLDPLTGVIGNVGTLPGWQGGNLIHDLEKEFGVRVAVENDADAAALAERAWGGAKDVENYIYVTISTGIGGGIILSGKLYRGAAGAHPEIGHQAIDPSGPMCYCGLRGCWESLASGLGIEAWMQERNPRTVSISAKEICELAKQGDALARECMAREAHYLGIGLANLITLFSPDVIGLGGGLMQNSSLFLDDALRLVNRVCTQVPVEKTRVTLARLGTDAGLLGAAQCWFHRHPG